MILAIWFTQHEWMERKMGTQGSFWDQVARFGFGQERRERQLQERGGIAEEMADCYGSPKYPDVPGYSNPTTSRDAAESMKPTAGTLQNRILSELQLRADFGATCDELEQAYQMPHQTVSARLREMALKGSIVDSGRKRATRSGRAAIVWHAKEGWR